ncbi:hypothetical protein OII53_22170 [Achromobacter ruhlandii]|uniref:hypothetical protein n=1 Tax=Achromobacter ruhlandii TaxID=72557 RepID=UPI001EEEFC9B|nr:hypothetical protein [Achromobacter ruhlandii]MCV6798523.1 hypothetical protein [Achromobacter ruhlandii]MCV6802161.1 hypothetical protein [Achromobacter ruhlandii]MCV6810861.1 hypothetical protein [Achromobacter ruhlandii]MCV6821263.1 hypothetical protein [Achromobacter ruhlandii]MCZ8398763.1 hypothetical protein [Achromobacter ruhlandii]
MSEAQVKLSAVELAALQRDFPALPQDYLDYLTLQGWGTTLSGRMLYSGPVGPEEIFGDEHHLPGVVLLGDDLAGYLFAFDLDARQYGEVDQRGNWQSTLIAKDICGYANGTPPGSV